MEKLQQIIGVFLLTEAATFFLVGSTIWNIGHQMLGLHARPMPFDPVDRLAKLVELARTSGACIPQA